ncbi:MAG: M23 family metallopeptidase [Clostridia bacterium]|nr:M23 family metallopeptidase [Clostridia bacterium]
MEKTISPEERIRRAEEIYYRRRENSNSVRMSSSQVKEGNETRRISLYKKMIIQILTCILIYLVFSLIKEANYIFSEDVINKTKEFLSTDINFEVIVGQVGQFFQNNQDKLDFLGSWLKENNEQEENKQSENQNTENKENVQTNNNQEQNTQEENKTENKEIENKVTNEAKGNTNNETGIGGASNNETTVQTSSSGSSSKTQMQKDADYIKANFKLELPLKGPVTSRYGKREATEIVSENHYGIDLGVSEGTTVFAAMEGKVSLVSKEGEYGTHVKIVNKDITTIYAHCSKILVKQGATIKKGQKIALSGNTGRTTGPHLHFEIRRGNRTVDPELVLKF